MSERFIWIEETGECMNEIEIGYIINQSLHMNKSFIYQVGKCMNTTFGVLTQPFIKTTLSKKFKCSSINNVSRHKRGKF